MNKVLSIALVVSGLLLLDSPEAAANDQVRVQYQPSTHQYSRSGYHDSYRRGSYRRGHYRDRRARSHRIPRWLQDERSFNHWYGRSHYRRDEHLSWQRLFNLYRWETSRYRHHGRH